MDTEKIKLNKHLLVNILQIFLVILLIYLGYLLYHDISTSTWTNLKPHTTYFMKKTDKLPPLGGDAVIKETPKGTVYYQYNDTNKVYDYATTKCIKQYHFYLDRKYITRKQFIKFYKKCKDASYMSRTNQSDYAISLPYKLAKKIAVVNSEGFEYDVHIDHDCDEDIDTVGIRFKRKFAPQVYARSKEYVRDHNLK